MVSEKNVDGGQLLSNDEVLWLLADRRRRVLLQYLAENEGRPIPVEQLTDAILSRSEEAASLSRERLEITLIHQHLPLLSERGLLEYDRERNTVRYSARPHLEKLLVFVQTQL